MTANTSKGFDNAALSRSQRQNTEKLDIIQHTLIGTKVDALEWMINGAYSRGKVAHQQILHAAFPPPADDHDKHIEEALALFRDKALDDAAPDRLKTIVTAWPLAQEVRQFVEDQMLFLIHLVVNNGIDTILRRIASDDSSEPKIGILSKQDRISGVIPLPRSALHPAVGPGNIIAEDNLPKVVELDDDDGNVIDPEVREREMAALKAEAEVQEAAQKGAQKAAQKATQKEKKARLKANRRARLEAEEAVKKTEEDKMQQETIEFNVAKQLELAVELTVDDNKQQEAADFNLAKKLEPAEKQRINKYGPAQQVGTHEKPRLADGFAPTLTKATTLPRNYKDSEKAIYIMASPSQRTINEEMAQKKADLQKLGKEAEITTAELVLQQLEDMESSPKAKQIADAQWETVTKDLKTEKKAEAKRKRNLSKEADNARLAKKAVLTRQKEMAKAEEFEKTHATIQEEARLKVAKDAEADRNYRLANQQQEPTPVRILKDDKVNTPPPAQKTPVCILKNEKKVKAPRPPEKSFASTDILKNDKNFNTLQHAKKGSTPKNIPKMPQEGKRAAPLGNEFSSLHVENPAETSDDSVEKRKAARPTKSTTLRPALKVASTAEFPSLDGSTVPSKPSAPGSALAWSKSVITGVLPTYVPPTVEKASAFPGLDGSITPTKPSANAVAHVGNNSSWSDAVVRVAPATSAPARIERPDDFPILDGSIAKAKSSPNAVAAIQCSSFWSKTAGGGIAPSAVRKSDESTKEFPALEVSATPINASANAATGTGGALSWSKIAASTAAPATPPSAMDSGSAGIESSVGAAAREKPSDLIILSKSKKRSDKRGKSRYGCSACKEGFGNLFDLSGTLKLEQSHREFKLVYDPDGEREVIWANKPAAAHDSKTTKLFSEVAPHNKSPLALTKAEKKAVPSSAPFPGLDAGTITTEDSAEMIKRKKNLPLSSFSKPETTSTAPKVTSIINLPILKEIGKGSHTSAASKITFGSFDTGSQASRTTAAHEADAKDAQTVANPGTELLVFDATASPVTFDTGTTVKLPTGPVTESSPLVVTKTCTEAGRMKRRDSINFIRTRTDSRAAQLGNPLGPAGQTPSTPLTPLPLGGAVVSARGTSTSDNASAPVVSNQSTVQEQQVEVKRKDMGNPAYQSPAFHFPASFGDISINEPTGVDRSQKPKATPATQPASNPTTSVTVPKSTPATSAALKPFSSTAGSIAAAKLPAFQTEIKANSMCFACGRHGNAQINCPSSIELATGIAAVSSVVTTRRIVDGSAPKRLTATSTAEEYARMSAKGLCFACGHPGHAESSCPFFKDTSLTALRAAAKSNVDRAKAIAASSAGRHEVDDFPPLAQTPTAEQLAGMRARGQCLACGSRGHEDTGCPHYDSTRAAVTFVTTAPDISHNSEVVVNRIAGPPVKVYVEDITATATSVLPVVQTPAPVVDTALVNRVIAPPIKVVVVRAPGAGQTLNECQIEDRSAFLERMATLIRNCVPVGQPGGEVVKLPIPKRNGGAEIMTMVLPERRVFKHKRSKSVGDELDQDVSYYTKQEQEHFLRRAFLECKRTRETQRSDGGHCSVHDGTDPAAYCELDDADDLANREPSVRRNSISIPHLEGNPDKIPDRSGAFVRTHKRAPAALVSRIENPSSLAPVTKNVHVFCAGIGM